MQFEVDDIRSSVNATEKRRNSDLDFMLAVEEEERNAWKKEIKELSAVDQEIQAARKRLDETHVQLTEIEKVATRHHHHGMEIDSINHNLDLLDRLKK
jgi:5-bromo-4-chloroindolyl phosphate hydrolysis protein